MAFQLLHHFLFFNSSSSALKSVSTTRRALFAFRKGCHSGSQGWTQTEGSAGRRWEDAAGLLSPRELCLAQESPDDLTSSRLQKLFVCCESRDSRLVGNGHLSHDTTLPPQPFPRTCLKGCKRSPQREWSP